MIETEPGDPLAALRVFPRNSLRENDLDRDANGSPHPSRVASCLLWFPYMKKWLAIIGALAVFSSGCASLTEFKFVRPEDKPSPFIPDRNPYKPPQDPVARD